MVLYVYEKWHAKDEFYFVFDESERIRSYDIFDEDGEQRSVTGWTDWKNVGGSLQADGTRKTVYAGEDGFLYLNFSGGEAELHDIRDTSVEAIPYSFVTVYRAYLERHRRFIKGDTLIDVIIAEQGAYPTDGYSGGYYYVRKSIATPPKLTSPDGGEVITWKHNVTWNNTTISQQTRIELSTDNGKTWRVLTTVGKGISSHEYDFSGEPSTSQALIRIAHFDGQYTGVYDTSDGVFQIDHNKPPIMPTDLQPNNKPVDRTRMQFLTWKYNDPDINDKQTKFDLRYRPQGSTTWTNISEKTTDTTRAFPPNSFALGRVEWQVRTYDRKSEVSPWSSLAIFASVVPTNQPIITAPDDIVDTSRPLISWTSIDQYFYQVRVLDSGGTTVYLSPEVESKANAMTLPYTLINGATYTIGVRIKSSSGLWSDYTDKIVKTSYTSPAKPTINISSTTSGLALDVYNPTPTGGQPNVIKTEIYKSINQKWVLLSDIGESYLDLYATIGSNLYKAIVYGNNGANNESDIVIGNFITDNTVIVNTRTKKTIDMLNILSTDVSRTPEKAYHLFKGRSHLVPEVGLHTNRQISLIWLVQSIADLQSYIDSFNPHDIYLYRDREGRKFFVTIDNLDEAEDYEYDDYKMAMSMTEVDFYEGIDRDE